MTIFSITFKTALVAKPRIAKSVKLFHFEVGFHFRSIIIQDSLSIKLLIKPISLIRNLFVRIVKCSISIDYSIMPLPIVHSSIRIEKLSPAMTFVVSHLSFVVGSIVVFFRHNVWLKSIYLLGNNLDKHFGGHSAPHNYVFSQSEHFLLVIFILFILLLVVNPRS